ncbi:MAG: hypothetical protein WBA74_13905 [Cyclobacteriaceae bacterium]
MVFDEEQVKRVKLENLEILEAIENYALIKGDEPDDLYTIFDIKNQNKIYAEYDHSILTQLMIEKGVKIVSDEEEVTDPNFVRYMYKYDEKMKKFIKVRAPS